ncbi:MAG: molybdenum cofactor biosynthesis protein B [Polyangiales bacterium]
MAKHAHPGETPVTVVTVTVSDTRTPDDDEGGALLRELLSAAGFTVLRHAIVPDDPQRVREAVTGALDAGADAVITTGGTGIAPRDQTYEAVTGVIEKTLDGFGEAFRRLSWEQVGARSILSRAVAGTRGRGVVIALPGSPKAVRLAVEALIAPTLGHMVALLRG